MMGEKPEACNMNGYCSIQFVVEGDGGIYPCDFYVYDEWKLGNVGEQTFQEIVDSPKAQKFITESLPVPEEVQNMPLRQSVQKRLQERPDADGGAGHTEKLLLQSDIPLLF